MQISAGNDTKNFLENPSCDCKGKRDAVVRGAGKEGEIN